MKVNYITTLLITLFVTCCLAQRDRKCVKVGRTCKYSFGKLEFNRDCCSGATCVDGTCLPVDGGNKTVNPRLPMMKQRCDRKMRNVNCGDDPIEVLGPYCVCGCPKFHLSYFKFGESCVPTTAERRTVILLCLEYKRIRDCPAYNNLFNNDRCQAVKEKTDQDCDDCGGTCVH